MRLLMLAPHLPYPPRSGASLRNWGLVRGLARGHQVSLLTFAAPGEALEVPPPLAAWLERSAVFPRPPHPLGLRLRHLLASGRPDLAWRLWSPALARTLQSWLAQGSWDWVIVEGLEMAIYAEGLRGSRPCLHYDALNCETCLQRRALAQDLRSPDRWPAAAGAPLAPV